jgi:hypothetical protein
MVCVLLGHWVRFVTARGGYDEFICVNCGHPFCFAKGLTGKAGGSGGRSAALPGMDEVENEYKDELENAFQDGCRSHHQRAHPEADAEGSSRRL